MRKLLFWIFLMVCPGFIFAQPPFGVSGTLIDTVNFSTTAYSSVSLIRASDSLLQTFTRADQNGVFHLEADSAGSYLLLIAHPSFISWVDTLTIYQAKTELGNIPLTSRKQLLDEVVITDAQAIVIKGDTIEYTADSFQVRAFDNVDELLKKLPGIEMGRDGKIKAYGKSVEKMLVDGEEFFSDDPAIVAQTLRASAVDKVQVFDKKSDQAVFTGIDDGELIKTINLKLKDDAQKGYFGRISAGAGAPGYWENQAMLNSFKKKRKISTYGIMSNTNNNGLGWEDKEKYGSGNNFEMDDNGNYVSADEGSNPDSDWSGQFNGEGLPKTWNGGVHYNNKWYGDTLSFNGSYRYNKNIREGINNERTQYILPDTQYVSQSNNSSTSIVQRHNLNTTTEYLLDSTSSIKATLGAGYSLNNNRSQINSRSDAMDGAPINDNNRYQEYRTEVKNVKANVLYRKRFNKKGRSFSANFTGNWSETIGSGLLKSMVNLYAIDSSYRINQNKQSNGNSLNGNLKLSYTEPLSKVVGLELNYSLGLNNNNAENSSYDRAPLPGSGETEIFNPLFSSNYIFNATLNQGGANLSFNFKRINFSFGGNVADTRFKQEDLFGDSSISYSYLNFFPRFNFNFNKSQTTAFRLRYNGRSRQPTISQLQPFRNNTDPLNVAIGNPDLKQEFAHNLNLSYNSYKVLSQTNFWLNGGLILVQNAISQMQNVDVSGRRTYQYVNVDGNFNASLYGGYSTKTLWGIYASAGVGGSYFRSNNFVNGLRNRNEQFQLSPNFSLRYNKDTTFDLNYDFSPGYNSNHSSIRPDVKTTYWSFVQNLEGSVNLPLKIRVGTNINWNIRQKLDQQDRNNNVFRWNAYVSRSFLKDRSLVAKFYVNDILNQNKGYTRNSSADYIYENTYNTVRRYFLLSLTWNFTKMGGAAPVSQF